MHACVSKYVSRVLALAFVALMPVALAAQATAAAGGTPAGESPSRWDIFAGYSALIPNATVNGHPYNSIDYGAILSISRYFNRNVGLTFEGDEHVLLPETKATSTSQPGDDFAGGYGGVIFRIPGHKIEPFFHGLVGAERVGGYYQQDVWGLALTAGGGFDLGVSRRLSIRLAEGDYQYLRATFPAAQGGTVNFNPQGRISAGLVLHVGSIAPPPQLIVSCAVNPTSVFPGDPVTANATVGSQDPKLNVVVSITGDGVSGTGATANVNTAGLSTGQHTVTCNAKEGKPGHEGMKPWQVAAPTTASFTVKEYEPPTISCSANPTTLKPGDSSTVSATGMSPQNRPLTYTYSASAGTINGSGTTATFSSSGAPTGPVSITCNVSDDKGHNASANTGVSIEAPAAPPQPHTQTLCSVTFSTDKKRPTRVDNEAKACLDSVALSLQQSADAKAVVVGESTAKEKAEQEKAEKLAAHRKHAKPVENIAAQRAVNAKQYLVSDKGIDPSRISVATGSGDDQKVEDYLVPSGASFSADITGTSPVDETTVKPQERKPLNERHRPAHHPRVGNSLKPPQ